MVAQNRSIRWWVPALVAGWCFCVAWAHPEIERQIADVTVALASAPDDARLYLRRGELHRIHQDWKAAEADYRRAQRVQPQLADVDFYRGRMQLEAGRYKSARRALDRFLERQPEHPKALVARARTLVGLGQPRAAAEDYSRSIELLRADLSPDPSIYLERARALVSIGPDHLDTAIRGLDEGLERLGHPITLELQAIDLELERGRHDAALARLDRIASRVRRQEPWLMRRGEILEAAGRPREARGAYASALEAIERLPASRRGNRAVRRLAAEARAALERLDAATDKRHG